jgi:DNA-binding MarR family transcriptional regulator
MSIRSELFGQLASKSTGADGWITVSSAALAEELGRNATTVSKMLGSLADHGNIETRKDTDGRVEAVRILREPRSYRGSSNRSSNVVSMPQRKSAPRRFGENTRTPNVDEYAKAKEAYEKVVPQLGVYVSASFKEQPLAEEALALKKHNEALLSQLQQLREQHSKLERDAAYLRKVNDDRLRKGLSEAGVLVEHSAR